MKFSDQDHWIQITHFLFTYKKEQNTYTGSRLSRWMAGQWDCSGDSTKQGARSMNKHRGAIFRHCKSHLSLKNTHHDHVTQVMLECNLTTKPLVPSSFPLLYRKDRCYGSTFPPRQFKLSKHHEVLATNLNADRTVRVRVNSSPLSSWTPLSVRLFCSAI